jgi:hypothetical protein
MKAQFTRISAALLITTALSLMSACSSISVETYRDRQPAMLMETFFNGPLRAHGIVKNRSGEVIRTFNASIDASWNGTAGVLDEHFTFDDGEKQQRIWQLQKTGPGEYIATANDVIGESHIRVAGNSVFLNYTLEIDYKGKPLQLQIDDRMYLTSPKVMINESKMSKLGFTVGSLVLVIEKDEE